MTDLKQRKQQLVMQGAVCRAQILNAGSAIRRGTDIRVLADQAKHLALDLLKEKFYVQQKSIEKMVPVVLDGVLTASSASTRYLRKPVLYGAMILGAVSVLPRFFKGRKSNDHE